MQNKKLVFTADGYRVGRDFLSLDDTILRSCGGSAVNIRFHKQSSKREKSLTHAAGLLRFHDNGG